MELAQLRYFFVAAQHEHITRAAKELHIAQPALTQAIQRLERELGVPLFEKKGRGICLTEYGILLQKRAEEVFSILDHLEQEFHEISQGRESNVRVNVLAASTLVVEMMIAYKKKHQEVNFQLIQNAEDPECDLCVTTGVTESQVEKTVDGVVLSEKICLAVPAHSEFAKKKSLHLEEITHENFISLSHEKPLRTICDRICMSAGFLPKIIFETENPSVFRDMIGAGLGIGFWPVHSWGTLASQDVVMVPLDHPFCKRDIMVKRLHPAGRTSAAANDFYQYIIEHFQKRNEWQEE